MTRKSDAIPIPEAASAFPDLTPGQLRLLGYCAYRGSFPVNPWTVTLYDGRFEIPKNRTEADRKVLEEKGLLVDGEILPQDFFRIALLIVKHFPEWARAYGEFSRFRSETFAYLWSVAECIAAGDLSRARKLRFPAKEGAWKYFTSLLFRDGSGDEILSILPQKEAELLLGAFLKEKFEAGELDDGTLARVRESVGNRFPRSTEIPGQADAYAFYLKGVLPPETNPDRSFWTEGIRATDLLLRGQLSESLEAFLKARNLTPPGCDGTFPDRLMTWFYALCLVRNCRKYQSSRAERALDALKLSTGFRYDLMHACTQTLLTHMDEGEKNCLNLVSGELRKHLERDRSVLGRDMALAVLRYFKADDRQVAALGLDPAGVPCVPIFRNETVDLCPTVSSEKQRLRERFGGPGVLSAVPRKEAWEMALSDLSASVASSQEEDASEKRIIYFVDEKWITAVLEQRRMPGETEWSKDKLLSRSQLIKGGYDSMDVIDLKIARELGGKVVDKPDTDIVIPLLAGTGRLFTGQFYRKPYTPLPVTMEAPFVAFSGKDGAIKVSSNVRRKPDGTVQPVSIFRIGSDYICVRTNPVQRDILSRLLAVGTFPVSALPVIRHTIASLEGILDVRSDLSAMAVIPTLQGSARTCVRITPLPDDGGYGLDLSVAPLEDGDLRCEPGRGAEDVYDSTGAEPRFIRRDLQTEYDNFSELTEYLKHELELEFEDGKHCSLYASESLLGVLSWAYDHRDRCFIEWPEGRALRFRGDVKDKDIDITVKSGVNWFEVEGQVFIDGEKHDLAEILEAMRRSDVKGFIRLGDKDYVRMTKALQRHLQAMDEMMSMRAGKNKVVPVYRVGHLAQILGDEGGLHGTMDEGFKSLLDKMQQAYDTTPEIPSSLKATLRDYQKEGYVWMKRLDAWGAGACLADDMGLGKTVQSIAFLLSKASEGPSLVVAPKSVVPNWDIEVAKFAPSLKVTVLNDVTHRDDCIAAAGPGEIVLTTYGVLSTETKALSEKEWNVVCLDEAHQIKNRNTRVSAAAMALQARSRLILTGTPLQNHLGELWNLFQFINPGLLGDWADFKARYLHGDLDEQHSEFLRDLVQPFILRRTKEEVLDELPEKIVCEQMVELSPEEMQVYEAMRQYVEERVNRIGGRKNKKKKDDTVKVEFFAELTKLRLAALSMSLVHDDWKLGSSKTDALMGLLESISAVPANQVVVFSQFTSYLAEVRALLDRKSCRYLYLDGQTELEERGEIVRQFQDGDCPLLLASLKAGGLGLNLTAANYVILLDPWWNPAIENQAMDRAHRIGQQRMVTVIRLIARHTIEEKILRLHETKQALADEMLDGTAYSGKLTMDDVLDMVSPFR